jgi:hypothetical protein
MENNYTWTDGIEEALKKIHSNSLLISDHHTQKYYCFKGYQKYFRISIIVLSGINSVFNVGLQEFISQGIISVLCCGISLICSIISSIELFIGIQTIMENEIEAAKEFYILSTDIFKILAVDRDDRNIDGKIYLDNIHSKYCNLIQKSEVINEKSKEYKLYIKQIDIVIDNSKYKKIINKSDEEFNSIKNNSIKLITSNSNFMNNENINNKQMNNENINDQNINDQTINNENINNENINNDTVIDITPTEKINETDCRAISHNSLSKLRQIIY